MALPCGHSWNSPPVVGCNFCVIRDIPFHRARWGGPEEVRCKHRSEASIGKRIKLNCVAKPPVELDLYACTLHGECTEKEVGRGAWCCARCSDKPKTTLIVNQGAGGIGDALQGLLAVNQLRIDNPEAQIVYRVSALAQPFVQMFDGYDILTPHIWDEGGYRDLSASGERQLNTGYLTEQTDDYPVSRIERYCKNVGASGYTLPPLRQPIKPLAGSDYVVLAPNCTDPFRTWPLEKWEELERRLEAAGHRTVILSDKPFPSLRGGKVVKEKPEIVARVISSALVNVCNDSGPAHISAILGKPTVVVGGHMPVHRIYNCYPRVACVGDPTGKRKTANVPLDSVLEYVDNAAVFATTKGRSLLSLDRLVSLRNAVLKTNDLPGEAAEFGVFRGGSARLIWSFGRRRPVSLFDTFAGIPDDDEIPNGANPTHKAGDFADVEGVLDFIRAEIPNAVLYPGRFPETVPPGSVNYRLVHVDADTYQSTRAAVDYFGPRMVRGGVMVFDDYGWKHCPGVAAALTEGFGPERIETPVPNQALVRF